LVDERAEELTFLECIDNGRTIDDATIQILPNYVGWADEIRGSVVHPSGLVLQVCPFL